MQTVEFIITHLVPVERVSEARLRIKEALATIVCGCIDKFLCRSDANMLRFCECGYIVCVCLENYLEPVKSIMIDIF